LDPVLSVPRRLVASVASSIDAVGELPDVQHRLLEHVISMNRAILRLEASVLRIERCVATIAERTPDPNPAGPIAKAKEAITGGE
jgi:hypothetical protein